MTLFFNKEKESLIEIDTVVLDSRSMGVIASHKPKSKVIIPKTGKQ